MLKKALRLLGVLAASTLIGAGILLFCQSSHLQIPELFVVWLPDLMHVDGESAYDAAELAFFVDMNVIGLVLYFAARRAFRPVAS